MYQAKHSISLLFNANKVYDRQVIEGIGHYLQSSKVDWDVYLEEDFLARLEHIDEWSGDGIIADFDDPAIQAALVNSKVPIVGVGGSYSNESDYPNVPYVATDNYAVVKAAYEHLKKKGLERFAFYGFPSDMNHRWAIERERAMLKLCKQDGYDCSVYRGHPTRPETWQYSMNRLTDWIQGLPNPVGIVSVTDARARHILQACEHAGKLVPDNISIVGIDDDDIARNLSRISLSSVTQGCFDMGFQAAKLLHRYLDNPNLKSKRVMVSPVGVSERQSTDFKALKDPFVIQAMHYIRQNACRGIKVEQVLDYVGVSRSNLEQRFREERGHSIHTEIHNEKLAKACKLLSQEDMSTNEVAQVCGYPSLQYMYAVFKKHFDQTPREFRDGTSKADSAEMLEEA
jgi:LacI family transcriptional regulator